MQRILDCKDKFIFTKDKLKEVLQRYVDMDKSGAFADMIGRAPEIINRIRTILTGEEMDGSPSMEELVFDAMGEDKKSRKKNR